MNELLGLAGFALVGTITPGPNNALLLASGIRFGFGRTVPHVAGTALGMSVLILAVAAGVGALLLAVPAAGLALKVAGSVYLLVLAYRIASSRGRTGAVAARPFGVVQAAAFQLANLKGWLFAVAAVSTFRPAGLAPLTGMLAVTATCAVVILATASVWAAGGAALDGSADGGRAQRAISLALALVLAASVLLIWLR
jgi:threonine/homoserine/homoserine lactone efflux protein